MAFSNPYMVWPVGQFHDGDDELAEDEIRFAAIFDALGLEDIGDRVRRDRRWQEL